MSTSSAARATRGSVGLRSERGPILLAVMLSVGLVAIDSTILATAVPSVVSDLHGGAELCGRSPRIGLELALSRPQRAPDSVSAS